MTIVELEAIEKDETVTFSLNGKGRLEAEGTEGAVNRAIGRIAGQHVAVAAILRERQGLPDPAVAVIVREISLNVPTLEIQRANYVRWFSARPRYFHPADKELDLMFATLEEGDEVLPDFSSSFTVRKRDGRLVTVDRKGGVTAPGRYAPALNT